MKSQLSQLINQISFGTPQSYNNLTMVPLLKEEDEKIQYTSLKKALAENLIEITEVNEVGHVPELKVVNKSDEYILIIDGEQFVGAKQNRIINASILIDKHSHTIINVACVEEGRWSYKSKNFGDSDFMLEKNIREKKMMSVLTSLKTANYFRADQGEIWDEVHNFQMKVNFRSKTSSMEDAYKSREKELKDFSKSFQVRPMQRGMLIFVDGKISGIEYLSSKEVFSEYFEKILHSYTAGAFFDQKNVIEQVDYLDEAKKFLLSLSDSKESKFKSIGLGDDIRLESNSTLASALIVNDEVIHLVGFNQIVGYNSPQNRKII